MPGCVRAEIQLSTEPWPSVSRSEAWAYSSERNFRLLRKVILGQQREHRTQPRGSPCEAHYWPLLCFPPPVAWLLVRQVRPVQPRLHLPRRPRHEQPGRPRPARRQLAPNSNPSAPSGSALAPSPSFNSTPSQSNVDLNPPSRLTNPGGPAGRPPSGQVPQGQMPQGSDNRPQPGGANSATPIKAPAKTGTEYSVNECMGLWDAGTHMTKAEWKVACARVQHRLDDLEAIATETGTKRTPRTSAR